MQKLNSLFAVLALSGITVGAQAQTTMTTTNRFNSGYGINYSYNGVSGKTTPYAGPFATTIVGPGFTFNNFDSYCVDLGHSLQASESISLKDIKTVLKNGAQVAYLYDTFAAGVDSASKGAALQIAIWEVEYDYGTAKGINTNDGLFQFTGVVNDSGSSNYNSIVNLLTNTSHTGYLDNVPSSFSKTAAYLDAGTSGQSLVGLANVPEPGTVSLMVSSLIGLSAFALRRKRKV